MHYLRFTREDYAAITQSCDRLDFQACRPRTFQRFLVAGLITNRPDLAQRIRHLEPRPLGVLHEHLRAQQAATRTDFTSDEVFQVLQVYGPLIHHARFLQPLKVALTQHLRRTCPDLARKLARMGNQQFERLCEQLKQEKA